jgi:hypothetical protein
LSSEETNYIQNGMEKDGVSTFTSVCDKWPRERCSRLCILDRVVGWPVCSIDRLTYPHPIEVPVWCCGVCVYRKSLCAMIWDFNWGSSASPTNVPSVVVSLSPKIKLHIYVWGEKKTGHQTHSFLPNFLVLLDFLLLRTVSERYFVMI